MKNITSILLLIVGIVFMGSCRSPKNVVNTFNDFEGEWRVSELNGVSMHPADSRQVISFDTVRKLMSGNAGCNRMSGSVEYNPTQPKLIKFMRIATTRMACPDMESENELLEALRQVVRFEPVGGTAPFNAIAFYGITDNKILEITR